MRVKSTLFTFVLIGGLFFSSSCKKTEETIIEPIKPGISANIDGALWTADTFSVTKAGGIYTVSAFKDEQSIIMVIEDLKVGTYPFNITDNSAVYSTGSDIENQYIGGVNGELEVTAIINSGKEFEGQFNFIGINSNARVKSITQGSIIMVTIPK